MKRAEVLKEAEKIVCADRNREYGEPEDNFTGIARLWEAYLGMPVEAEDVAILMVLFKIGRLMTAKVYKPDSYIDACGYLACAAELGERQGEKKITDESEKEESGELYEELFPLDEEIAYRTEGVGEDPMADIYI